MVTGRRHRVLITICLVVVIAGIGIFFASDKLRKNFFKATPSSLPEGEVKDSNKTIEVVAKNLNIPWDIAFLPSGDILTTERSGTLKRIGAKSQTYVIDGVQHVGEGGLLGLALHPDFEDNNLIYLYLTTKSDNGLTNRVESYQLNNKILNDRQIIIENIPGASNHDGGKIAFGPDEKLYITTGDAGREAEAQNKNSLAGKILRINEDGTIPSDNPFGNAVYSYGHRNPQGIVWDDKNRMWATEHGRSGINSGFDELNRIVKGGNYGWPAVQGDEQRPGMIKPIVHSGASETWAPGGITYRNGSLFFTGLRGESLYVARIENENKVSLKSYFRQEYGRLRASATGPNDFLYISTSNRDGRGNPKASDDQIIKVGLKVFN